MEGGRTERVGVKDGGRDGGRDGCKERGEGRR